MNKVLWKLLILLTSILFLGGLFLKNIILAVFALVLALLLDKQKPQIKKNTKKVFLSDLKKGRKLDHE